MGTEPKISVVTICFQAERFIRTTIESVLAHQYPNIEYIVIDGGSKDSTPQIIKEYESRLGWWVSEPDRGVSDAFNKGILRHTGDFICFLNAGDYFFSKSSLAELLSKTDPTAEIIYGKTRVTFNPPFYGYTDRIVGADVRSIHKLPTAHQAMLYSRRIWERFGVFSLDYRYAMDYEHYLRYRKVARYSFADVIVVERPLTPARNSFGSGTRTYREYLKADIAHRNPGIVFNLAKLLRYKVKRRLGTA
jgi:glycosyltransferase involved in cell wall biosynthesis